MGKSNVSLVLDLQFGSTGKGALCGFLAERVTDFDTVAAAWGPNAGHTYIDDKGSTFIHTMLPIGAVARSVSRVLLGPGSCLNLEDLVDETVAMQKQLLARGDKPRRFALIIHPQATFVSDRHREKEKANVKIGSTMKGTGAALIEKVQRDPGVSPLMRDMGKDQWASFAYRMMQANVEVFMHEGMYHEAVGMSRELLVEGAQGFSLGLHRHFWPYTTSREISPAQVMADCSIPHTANIAVYGTLRTYPIRVANRYDADGKQIGTSGPYYEDQKEISFEEIGVQQELTTVTKLPRRVFTFSYDQLRDACRVCKPISLFLNFANYVSLQKNPLERRQDVEKLCIAIDQVAREATGSSHTSVDFVGWGPAVGDITGRPRK